MPKIYMNEWTPGKPLIEYNNVQQELFHKFRQVEASRQFSLAAFVYNRTFTQSTERHDH